MKKREILYIAFSLLAVLVIACIYQYRYLLWYTKIDIIKEIPPYIYKIETNFIDLKNPLDADTMIGFYSQSPNGAVLKYPGMQVGFYMYESRSRWIYLSLATLKNKTVGLSIWLNNNFIDFIMVRGDQKEAKIFLPENFVKIGWNSLYFIYEDQNSRIVLSEIYFSEYLINRKSVASNDKNDPGILRINGRGEVVFYVELPEDPFLNYSVSYTVNAPKNKRFNGKIELDARTDNDHQHFGEPIKINSGNNNKWIRYAKKIPGLGNKKTRLTFTLYFDDKELLGKLSFKLKAEIRGKINMTEKNAAVPVKKNPGMNVLFIILDAASAAHMSAYGYPIKTTPNIDKLAENSFVFTRAYTTAVFTRGSTSSLFTSLYPYIHDVVNFTHSLPSGAKTLAEVFAENGYRTAMFTSNGNVSDQSGMNQGFLDYYSLLRQFPEDMTSNIKDWLEKHKDTKYFIYAHYRHPHPPFDAPLKLRAQFNKTHLPTLEFNDPLVDGIYKGDIKFTKEQRDYLISQYDANIYYVDQSIQDVISYVLSNDYRKNTIIIIAADHGEAMGEHEAFGHGWDLHRETSWIPLIIYHPLYTGHHIISGLIDNVDIMPTLIELLDLKGKPALMQGNSFAECLVNSQCRTKSDVYVQSLSNKVFSVIDDHNQLIYDTIDRKWQFYDLNNDRDESHNIFGKSPITTEYYQDKILRFIRINNSLKSTLSQTLGKQQFQPTGEVLENLKALGYIK